MWEKYYSVEKISEMLSLHPKTIQRYIREGKLRANKIGKSWRVTGHDLSVFMERENNSLKKAGLDQQTPWEYQIRVSSVVDIKFCDPEDASRIINTMTAVLNSKPPEYGISSMHTQYIGEENKVRIMLWGGLRFMENIMNAISTLTEQAEEREEEE